MDIEGSQAIFPVAAPSSCHVIYTFPSDRKSAFVEADNTAAILDLPFHKIVGAAGRA